MSSVQAPCISMVPRRVHEVPCPKEQARQRPLLFPFPCCPVPRYMSSVSVPPALVSRLQRMYLLSPGTGCHLLDQAIYSSRLVLESLQGLGGWVCGGGREKGPYTYQEASMYSVPAIHSIRRRSKPSTPCGNSLRNCGNGVPWIFNTRAPLSIPSMPAHLSYPSWLNQFSTLA